MTLAEQRPDLRIAVTGMGREVPMIEDAAKRLANLTWLGWVDDIDPMLARGRVIYYGQDPALPYSRLCCPNTLYQALAVRRPIVFFCEGEIAAAARRWNIGVHAEPTADGLATAVDVARAQTDWDFDAAYDALVPGYGRDFDATLANIPELR